MPGPWVAVATDPDGWAGTTLHDGDYVEFACYDTSHCTQGTVLGRVDRLTERTRTGQWAEIAFIAVSDEHLRWWLNHAGQQEGWQFEVHFCATSQRGCRQSHRGRGMDFHTDRFRVVTIADLSEKKIDWLKASASKKDVEEELKRLSNLPTGKDGEQGEKGGEGLPFADGGLPPSEPSEGDPALQGLAQLEKELGKDQRARKRQGSREKARPLKREDREKGADKKEKTKKAKKKKRRKSEGASAHGRAASAPAATGAGGWFGQPERPVETVKSSSTSSSPSSSVRKKKKKKDKDKAKQAKDRGPFGAGAEMDYGDGGDSGDSTDESRLFSRGPPLRRKLPAVAIAGIRPATAGASSFQTSAKDADYGREGGGAVDNLEEGNQDTAGRLPTGHSR